jgi:NitT/TauT family transport system substrate-binding protein
MRKGRLRLQLVAVLLGAAVVSAAADEIAVSSYGVAPGSMPWAVALAKGYFKEEGVNITAIRSSPGGAPTVRDLIGGSLPYAEGGITAVVTANQAGADLKIVSCNVNTLADVPWVTMPNSPIKSIDDLKGKRIGFTTAKSTTNMLAVMLLQRAGLGTGDAQLIATGGFPQALTALEAGGVDIAPMVEVDYIKRGANYRLLARTSDVLPPMSNVVGIVSAKVAAKKPEDVKGIIAARRKALRFMKEQMPEAAKIIAEVYQQKTDTVENTIRTMLESGKSSGVDYWGEGGCDSKLLDQMLAGAKLVGMVEGQFDVASLLDLSFLPGDLRK